MGEDRQIMLNSAAQISPPSLPSFAVKTMHRCQPLFIETAASKQE